jgi:hypothetical protein
VTTFVASPDAQTRAAGRALPDEVVAQLLDESALDLLEEMFGITTCGTVELLADTGWRPNEICILTVDCLDFDTERDEHAASRSSGCWCTTCRRSRALAAGCRSTRPPSS